MLRVRLLGELALELDGVSLPAPSSRPTRALLAWLALHPGMHARSRLAGRLWPEVLDESARASLRKALADLRRTLGAGGGEALITTRQEVGLSDVWVDVVAFEELVAAGRLEEAVELCRGELLSGLDDDWAYEARDEHGARFAIAIAGLGDAAEEEGDLEAAVRRARELVAVEPLSEEAHRTLIRRLGAAGDRAAALAGYARLRERLRRELGVAPSAETRALVERLRRGDALAETETLVVERPPLPSGFSRRVRSAFVGRSGELVRLREAWDAVSRGELQAFLVGGEPGIGKTRLAAEFARVTHAAGAAVLLGRCYEERLVAYQPLVEALRPLLAKAEGRLREELRPLVPGLSGAELDSPGTADGPDAARFRLFEAVREALASASRERPVLLVLEDLHWADDSTLLLLAHVLRAPDPGRLLVVGTYRDAELGPDHPLADLLADLRRERVGERIVLRGLGKAEVAELIGAALGEEAPPALAHRVHRETEGNPFFVEEILRHVEESGVVDGGRWDVAELGVPEGVKEVIGRRVSRLGADAAKVLAVASVLGREFRLGELDWLVDDLTEERLLGALEQGLRASLIREERGRGGCYDFAHALVREAVYEGLTAGRRRQLHLRAAETLERRFGDRPDRLGELAHHLFQSASPATARHAADYAERAGELALSQLAYEEAAVQFDRALQALDLLDRPAGLKRAEILLALGDAYMRAGEREEGRRAFSQAAAAGRALDRPELLAHAALGYGGIGVTIATPDQKVVGLLEEALATLGRGDDGLRARLLARLAVEATQAAPDRSESLSADAIGLARPKGDARTLVETLSARHLALPGPGHVKERLEIADEMVALAASVGDRVAELQGRHWRVLDVFQLGDVAALERELEAYTRLAEDARLLVYEWYAPMWEATLAIFRGRLDEAKRFWSRALELGRRAQDANAEIFFRSVEKYYLPLEQGRAAEMDLDWLRKEATRPEVTWVYRTAVARILAECGRLDAAKIEFEMVAADGFAAIRRDVHFFAGLAEWAVICSSLGDGARAEEVYDLYLPYRALNIVHVRGHYCYGSAEHYLGLLAAMLLRWPVAVEHFEAALESYRRWAARPYVSRTLCAYAEMLLARNEPGDRDRARSLAREAFETAEQVNAKNLVERARAATRQALAAQIV